MHVHGAVEGEINLCLEKHTPSFRSPCSSLYAHVPG